MSLSVLCTKNYSVTQMDSDKVYILLHLVIPYITDIRSLVHNLKDRGIGVLITDHNVKNLFDITDRNYVLGEHTVIAEGTSRELLKSTKAIEHYFGSQFS